MIFIAPEQLGRGRGKQHWHDSSSMQLRETCLTNPLFPFVQYMGTHGRQPLLGGKDILGSPVFDPCSKWINNLTSRCLSWRYQHLKNS